MNTTDPVADYLTRIRNAIQAGKKRVEIPASNMKRDLSRLLSEKKYINGFTEIPDNRQGMIKISLKYTHGTSAIAGLERVSRPGLRVYAKSTEMPRVLNGLGIAIISTSRGILADRDAKAQKLGGEVLCKIW